MTIAACHVSPEGVVLGADSTTSISTDGHAPHAFFDFGQKLFEVGGPGSTLGVVTWGLGQIGDTSHRTRIAQLGRDLHGSTTWTVHGAATRLQYLVQDEFEREYAHEIALIKSVEADLLADRPVSPETLEAAETIFQTLRGGYCLGGRGAAEVTCSAYAVEWDPLRGLSVTQIDPEAPVFWGVPHFIQRLVNGYQQDLPRAILDSGRWNGTIKELLEILAPSELLAPEFLPIREAIDWIHTILHATIKAQKFAQSPHLCGGPCEIAVVTTDRPFRWVRHKGLDDAIGV